MGVAGWRFAHMKRNLGGRAAIVAVLEEWPVICSVVVTASSMIMIGITLYKIGRSESPCGRPALRSSTERIQHTTEGGMLPVLDLDPVRRSTGAIRPGFVL